MTKNPILNALGAAAYISIVVAIMNLIMKTQGSKPDSAFAPVVFLSMLTLSVTVMACMFFYQPLQFILSGKKKEALSLTVQTVGVFAIITVSILALLFAGVL